MFRPIVIIVASSILVVAALGAAYIGMATDNKSASQISAAKPYDDPAVVICELGVKRALAEGVQYRRTNSAIEGLLVHSDFETIFGQTEPKKGKVECQF